jgi:hypothetical protein
MWERSLTGRSEQSFPCLLSPPLRGFLNVCPPFLPAQAFFLLLGCCWCPGQNGSAYDWRALLQLGRQTDGALGHLLVACLRMWRRPQDHGRPHVSAECAEFTQLFKSRAGDGDAVRHSVMGPDPSFCLCRRVQKVDEHADQVKVPPLMKSAALWGESGPRDSRNCSRSWRLEMRSRNSKHVAFCSGQTRVG